MWMETDIGQLHIAPKLRVPYKGPYMVRRWLGALDYEVHTFCGNSKIVHHNRLKPYHGLKRPPGYYQALAEAKRDGPQPPFAVESQGQWASPVSQGRQLCRQREASPQIESVCPGLTGGSSSCHWSQGPHAGWLYLSMSVRDVTVTGVLIMSFCLSWMFQCVKCDVSQGSAEEVVQHFLREHLKPSEVPFACNQCQFRAHTRQVMVDHRRGEHQAPKGVDLDKICFGTLKPIREEEILSCCQYCTGLRQRGRKCRDLRRTGELEAMVGPSMGRSTVGTGTRVGPESSCQNIPVQ